MPAFILTSVPQIILVGYLVYLRNQPGPHVFGIALPQKRDLLVAVLSATALLSFYVLLSAGVSSLPQDIRSRLEPSYNWNWNLRWHMVLPFALVTGYREELFFRSYLVTRLTSSGSRTHVAVGAASLLFALGHVYQGPLAVGLALFQAVGFSLIFLKTRSLHGIAWAHAIYNSAVLLMVAAG